MSQGESKKRNGLIIGIVAAGIALCCIIAIVIGIIVATTIPRGTRYTAASGMWRIQYPEDWYISARDGDPSRGEMYIGSYPEFKDGNFPKGAMFYILYADDIRAFEKDISKPEELVDTYIITNFTRYNNVEIIQETTQRTIGGYPGATALVLVSYEQYGNVYHQVSAVVSPNATYLLRGVCPENLWSEYKADINNVLKSFKILTP